LHTVANQGNLGYVNSEIAKDIKEVFRLTNLGENEYPNSILIQSYTEFELESIAAVQVRSAGL
jgi:hypothetical protein